MIKLIFKDDFLNDLDFFKANIGYVYNLDNFENLKNIVGNRYSLNKENFEIIKRKMYISLFNEIYDNFLELDKNYFLSVEISNNRVNSIANFFRRPDGHWYIDGVETQIQSRNKGLATKVIEKGIEQIDGAICLQVYDTNLIAYSIYKKLGFKLANKKQQKLENIDDRLLLIKDNIK